MLRLPRLRGTLQLVEIRQPTICNLFEAYEDASSTLERLRADAHPDDALLAEYGAICLDIEADVILLCLDTERPSQN